MLDFPTMKFSNRTLTTFALCFLALSVAGCGAGSKIAATVNGHVITEKDVQMRMANLSSQARNSLQNDPKRLLEEMITENLLIQEARRRHLDRDSEVRRLLKEARRQILVGRLLEVMRAEKMVEITQEEIAQAYQANIARFTEQETFRASHILTQDEETAKKALKRVKGGEEFAAVAQELSVDPTRARGGDIGLFRKGQLIPEFEEVAMKLKPGEMSDVVKTSLGYHVILLTEHRASRQRPLEETREQIRVQLETQKKQRHVEETLQQLRADAKIDIKAASPGAPPEIPGAPLEVPEAIEPPPAE